MVARLRLISRKIPWFLARRAAVFGLAWLLFPFWAFLAVAVGLYLIPFFEPRRLWLPFAVTLTLSFVLVPSILGFLFLVTLFFLILGIKDLVFVDRKGAYETLTLLLLFGVFLEFFSGFPHVMSPVALLVGTVIAFVFFFLVKQGFAYDPFPPGKAFDRHAAFAVGLAAFVLWELTGVALFLPVGLFYATAFSFLGAVTLALLVSESLHGRLTRQSILAHGLVFGVVMVLLLNLVSWEL